MASLSLATKALLPPEGQETTLCEAEGEQKREGCSQSFRVLDTDFSAGKLGEGISEGRALALMRLTGRNVDEDQEPTRVM